jgi:NACHT NTPase-like protein
VDLYHPPHTYTMDPASLLGIIGTTVTIIEATLKSTQTIIKIADLPAAFKQVEKHLPLVKRTLYDAERTIKGSNDDLPVNSIEKILNECQERVEQLDVIFTELEEKCNQDKEKASWSTVRSWYRDVLRGIKGHRVEVLMKEIMGSLTKLGTLATFRGATQQDMEEIKAALKELLKVEPSLDDAEFGALGSNYATQNVAPSAVGAMVQASGGEYRLEPTMYRQGDGGTMNIGTPGTH